MSPTDSVEGVEDKKELQTLPFELVEDNLLKSPLREGMASHRNMSVKDCSYMV